MYQLHNSVPVAYMGKVRMKMKGILIDEETYSKMDEYDQNLCDTCQFY